MKQPTQSDSVPRRDLPPAKRNWLLAAALAASAAFYRPLILWAANAWHLSSPLKILLIGLALAAGGLALTWLTTIIGSGPLAGAGAVALAILVLAHWHSLGRPYLLLVAALAVGLVLHWLRPGARRVVAIVLIAVFGVAPLVQVLSAHLFRQDRYTMVDLEPRGRDATATGAVEDVLVVIVDGYPSIEFARERFGYEPAVLVADLTAEGFAVEEVAWSRFTRTALTVASMMELQPVVEADPPAADGTLLPLYELIRGDNLVAASLRSAGYEYHHIESGWDGGTCGPVDVCVPGPQIDETVWNLGVFSVARDWMASTHGNHFVAGSLNTVDRLVEMKDVFGDGQRDYVFAHLLLPHDPVVVDADCNIRWPRESSKYDTAGGFEKFREQLACTDRLISEVAAVAGENTAVLISGDHGTESNLQMDLAPEDWSDVDIAERFGILLAYRLPPSCDQPSEPTNLEAMRTLVGCVVDIDLPPSHSRFLIDGDEGTAWVDADRIRRVRSR